MTDKMKNLAILISATLIGLVALQMVYAYRDFRANTITWKSDVNNAVREGVRLAEEERVDRIQELFKKDLLNPALVKLEFEMSKKTEPRVKIYDVKTGELSTTHNFMSHQGNDTLSEAYLLNRVLETNRSFIADNTQLYWSDTLGARLGDFMKTVRVSKVDLERHIDTELSLRRIASDYEILVFTANEKYDNKENVGVTTDLFKSNVYDGDQVMARFMAYQTEVLKRSWIVLMVSLIVLASTTFCFILLMRTINKQRKLADLKDDFIDSVTHELLTPIATMKIALETLQLPEVLSDKVRTLKYLKVSDKELESISAIVHNVLNSSLHEQGEAALKYQEVDLNELIEGLILYHKERSNKETQFIYDARSGVQVYTDRQHLTNVLNNLIDNAIKYAQKEPVLVTIDLTEQPGEVSLVISDNGPGVAVADEERIFNKFYRAVDESAGSISGLGVGLYYVRNILKRLNGQVRLLHSSSKGSSFQVSLQLRSNEA